MILEGRKHLSQFKPQHLNQYLKKICSHNYTALIGKSLYCERSADDSD